MKVFVEASFKSHAEIAQLSSSTAVKTRDLPSLFPYNQLLDFWECVGQSWETCCD